MVSVVVITNRTDDAVRTSLRSVVEQDVRPLEVVLYGNGAPVEPPPELAADGVSVVRGTSPSNLGVAGGRNAAARLATQDVLLFLDDDAVLRPGAIAAGLRAFDDPEVGAVALHVLDPEADRTALWLYPVDVGAWNARAFDVPSFLGGAGMLRRSVFEQLGGFWDGYFREMEEIDFSWRMLSAGWRIRFAPDAQMEHAERTRRIYRHAVPSNVAMLWRLLPYGLALRQTLVKVPLFGWRAVRHGEVRDFLAGLATTARLLPRALRERDAVSPATVAQLRQMNAQGGWGKRLQWSLRPLPAPDLRPSEPATSASAPSDSA